MGFQMKTEGPPLYKKSIIFEAKKVILEKQLDRLANLALSDGCKLAPNITSLTHTTIINNNNDKLLKQDTVEFQSYEPSNTETTEMPLNMNKISLEVRNSAILKRYFKKWRAKTNTTSKHTEKLNTFIGNLKNYQQEALKSPLSVRKPVVNCSAQKHSEVFTNRFKSQKHIIDSQRSKIEEQNKIISELKLGIIREDLLKSIENTKIEIRDIFSNCSQKLLLSAPLLKAADEREKMMVVSQKAPKTIQKMQERAIERAQYREIILERKKLIEETRQRLLAEAIDKKKALEEEERDRNLKLVNEQRKKELLLQKLRLERKQEFERKYSKAKRFYHSALIKQCFRKLTNNYIKTRENYTLATEYCLHKQKSWIFKAWLEYVEAKYKARYQIADAHFEYKALANAFSRLKQNKLECVRSMQVAEDVYDFRLTSNTFIYWHRFVCKEIMLENKKKEIALKHINRKLLFQYFYQWRSLPVVNQLEKAKEEKKRKWRQKVWEVLPDYRPSDAI